MKHNDWQRHCHRLMVWNKCIDLTKISLMQCPRVSTIIWFVIVLDSFELYFIWKAFCRPSFNFSISAIQQYASSFPQNFVLRRWGFYSNWKVIAVKWVTKYQSYSNVYCRGLSIRSEYIWNWNVWKFSSLSIHLEIICLINISLSIAFSHQYLFGGAAVVRHWISAKWFVACTTDITNSSRDHTETCFGFTATNFGITGVINTEIYTKIVINVGIKKKEDGRLSVKFLFSHKS